MLRSKQYFVRYDFNRLAVYLSFRTPMGGRFPHFPPPLATPLACRIVSGHESDGPFCAEICL